MKLCSFDLYQDFPISKCLGGQRHVEVRYDKSAARLLDAASGDVPTSGLGICATSSSSAGCGLATAHRASSALAGPLGTGPEMRNGEVWAKYGIWYSNAFRTNLMPGRYIASFLRLGVCVLP